MKRRAIRTLNATDLSNVTGGQLDHFMLVRLASRFEKERISSARGLAQPDNRASFLRTIADLMNS